MGAPAVPLLGLCAFSGTGKTTLLSRLLPLLRGMGLRVAVIKHAHHSFDIDHPGKDSHALRLAGAGQIVIASAQRLALVREHEPPHAEPELAEAMSVLALDATDLVLVEGFKRAPIPKIELTRPARGLPLICVSDQHVIAVASDAPVTLPRPMPLLDLNDPQAVARFVVERTAARRR